MEVLRKRGKTGCEGEERRGGREREGKGDEGEMGGCAGEERGV